MYATIVLSLTYLIGAALVWTGMVHASQPYLFVFDIANYQIVPASVAGVLGVVLPYLQIVVGVCIIVRLARPTAIVIAIGIFAAFGLAQLSVLLRGMEIDCGCFGYTPTSVTWFSLLVPVAMGLACLAILASDLGLDRTALSNMLGSGFFKSNARTPDA